MPFVHRAGKQKVCFIVKVVGLMYVANTYVRVHIVIICYVNPAHPHVHFVGIPMVHANLRIKVHSMRKKKIWMPRKNTPRMPHLHQERYTIFLYGSTRIFGHPYKAPSLIDGLPLQQRNTTKHVSA